MLSTAVLLELQHWDQVSDSLQLLDGYSIRLFLLLNLVYDCVADTVQFPALLQDELECEEH